MLYALVVSVNKGVVGNIKLCFRRKERHCGGVYFLLYILNKYNDVVQFIMTHLGLKSL
jgi:hypothetical protein